MGSTQRSKMINLSMDIEDVYGDTNILNALLQDLINFLSFYRIPCDLYITGIRLETLTWLNDFLSSTPDAAKYIHVGYHSNTHSFKIIPVISLQGIEHISFIEERKYDFHLDIFSDKEGGILKFQKHFKQSKCFRCPAFCWSAEYFSYMRSKDMLFSTMDISYNVPFGYLDMTVLPVCKKPLEAYTDWNSLKEDIEPFETVSLYVHPARLIYDNFWDKCMTRNIYNDCRRRIDHFKQMIMALNNSFQMITIEEINNYYKITDHQLPDAQRLLCDSLISSWHWGRLPVNFYSEDLLASCKYSATTMFAAERII